MTKVVGETVFLSGATGFIGSHVALMLLQEGARVRAVYRSRPFSPLLKDTCLDWMWGDIKDYDRILDIMRGCRFVFHIAADYRLWSRNPRELYENNVKGTVNVMRAALAAGVEKVVYTSTVGVLGLNPDGSPADEKTPVTIKDMVGHYKRSKFLAEQQVLRFVEKGLPVVLVHPSTPVGPGDHKPTPTGRIIVDYLNGRMPAYLDTGLNIVHVRDVAKGHLLAMDLGRSGEKYILGNQNLTLAEIFHMLEAITGIPAPRFHLPYFPVLLLGYLNEVFSRLTGIAPVIPLEGVRMARRKMFFDPSKAVRELGLPQTPARQALEDAVRWFLANGYVEKRRGEKLCVFR